MKLGLQEREWVEGVARAEGFDLAGLAPVPDGDEDDVRFGSWVASGAAAEMEWLVRRDAEGRLIRGDVRRSMSWARSVLVCAVNYNVAAPRSIDTATCGTGWIARYAWSGKVGTAGEMGSDLSSMGELAEAMGKGRESDMAIGSDYHDELHPRLRAVASRLEQHFGSECQTRVYVDTGPVLERGYAARAGVGWIGRNTCVLNQQTGSWLLLGVVVTSLEVALSAAPMPALDRCGTCQRCVDACPTGALDRSGIGKNGQTGTEERAMDAARCIAYLTIEKKGAISPELREGMGRQVFGCDICQDVCPWNGRAPVGTSGMLKPRAELVNPSLEWMAEMDGVVFNRTFRGSPLERTRRKRILRNVAIAMGNSGLESFVPRLQRWAIEGDAVLAETARWALERITASRKETEDLSLRVRSGFDSTLD